MGVTPFGPGGQCWKAIANLVQEIVSVDQIEGIFEISRNEDFVGVVSIAVQLLRGSSGADLSARWGGNTDMERPEVSERAVLDSFAKAYQPDDGECRRQRWGGHRRPLFPGR